MSIWHFGMPRHSRRNALTFFALAALFAAATFATEKTAAASHQLEYR
jgi:hypothetical protein